MIPLGYIGLGFGIGVLLSTFKDWALIQNLLNRIQFHRPEDFFYAQHMQKEIAPTKPSPFAMLGKILPLSKRDKVEPVITATMAAEEIKSQLEKQATDEKELNDHLKAFEIQRRIQVNQGEM